MSQFCRPEELKPDPRSVQHDDRLRHSCVQTDIQYPNRHCEVTSSDTHGASHPSVPIKTSPEDPDIDPITSPLMQPLPLPAGAACYWPGPGRYVGGKAGADGSKEAGGWRGPPDGTELDHHPATSPLFEPCNLLSSIVKVEDPFTQDAPVSVGLPPLSSPSALSLASSSPPFSMDDPFKRNLLAERNAADPKQRRRRRPNPGLSPAGAMNRNGNNNNNNNNTRFPGVSTPASSTSACTAASMSAGVGCLPARLPFSLPPVPPGYRLVITHRPMADTSDDASQVVHVNKLFKTGFLKIVFIEHILKVF